MYMTGFADEAGVGLDAQIRATKELGWKDIESRNIDGINIHDIPDNQFEVVCEKLAAAGVGINCFGSTVANWACQITDPFEKTLEVVKRSIPRMQKLGTKLIRVMSYAVLTDGETELDDQMDAERFRRVKEFTKMYLDAGIQPVHENCMNYGGMSPEHTLRLLDAVPDLKLVFDTGNPVFTDDRSKAKPYPKQSAWEFYSKVKDSIVYIHIKDGIWHPEIEGGKNKQMEFTYAGEGEGDVVKIVKDAIASGYDGGISIEPHLGAVFHDPSVTSDEEKKFAMYVEYGHRMEKMIADIRAELGK